MEPSNKPKFFRLATLKEHEISNAEVSGRSLKKLPGNSMKMVNDFFHKLGKSLEKNHIGENDAAEVFRSKETWTLEDLISKIREFDEKITTKEIENVFGVLSSDDSISEQAVVKELKKAMKNSDSSSESSDISSPSEGELA